MLPPSDSQILRPSPACASSFDPLSRRRKSNDSGSGPSESAFERCEVIHVDHGASWTSFKLSGRLWLRQMRMNQMIEQLRRPVRARNQLAPLSVSRPRPVGRSIPSSPRSHVLPVSRPCRYPFRSPRGQQTRAAALRQLCRPVLAPDFSLFRDGSNGNRVRALARRCPQLMEEGFEDRRRITLSIDDARFGEHAGARERTEDDSRCGHLLQRRINQSDRQTSSDHAESGPVEGSPPSILTGGPKPARRKIASRWS